jgi:hypothetical protein
MLLRRWNGRIRRFHSLCQVIHHKQYTNWPGIELWPLLRNTGDIRCEQQLGQCAPSRPGIVLNTLILSFHLDTSLWSHLRGSFRPCCLEFCTHNVCPKHRNKILYTNSDLSKYVALSKMLRFSCQNVIATPVFPSAYLEPIRLKSKTVDSVGS